MITLDATTKKLQLLLSGAAATNPCPYVITYVDVTTTTYTPGETDGVTNGTTPVDALPAPAASTQRQIKFMSVQNADTADITLKVRYNNNATTRDFFVATIPVGGQLVYTDGEGFTTIDADGQRLTASAGSSSGGPTTLTGDVTGTGTGTVTTTIADNAVTNAQAANMATKTYKGRTSALTGDPEDVPVATLKSDLGLAKGDVGLGNVDNTSDASKPVSTAQQTALDLKANIASPTFTGTVGGITKSMVGLSNVDNTSDAGKPVSTAQQTALDLKAPVASPTFTGTVGGITKAMVGLGSVDNTSDAAKPVSTAQQTALDLKANLESPTFTGTVAGITKTMVGLGNVDNTSDASKPVSTAQQTALDLKANLAGPTFTGTVSGITKSMVGLGNVDNTSDAAKPVSTAQQTALDLKANLASPTFTGTVGGITSAMVGLGNVDNTSDATKNAASVTLTNKALSDTTTTIVNAADATKKIAFSAANVTTGTTLTIRPLMTTSRTLSIPDITANDSLVTNTAYATLYNKDFGDDSTTFIDSSLSGSWLKFNVEGTGAFPMTLKTVHTANRTLTLPNATDTLVGKATTDALTNKSFSDSVTIAEVATPATPDAGFGKIYFKADGKCYALNDAGTETDLQATAAPGSGTVSSVSVVSANGFAGTVATETTTPAITVSTSITGILKGNGTAISAAVAGDFPTLNQSTTGTAANATNTAITEDTATNATMFPTWVTANTGNLPQKTTSTKLTFNPSTGVLSSTSFTGAGTGLTGTAASLTVGNVTTNANLTGDVTSVGNATTLTNAPVIAKVLTGYTSGAGTVAATDSILQAVQKLNGNDVAAMGRYSTLLQSSGSHIAARVAGTYGMGQGDPIAISGTGTLYPLNTIYIASADYPTVGGVAPKLRIRAQLYVNDVAPTGNFTFGLYPITRPATSGGAGLNIYTLGTVVTGSNGATFTAPAADSIGFATGADFALPSDGHYVIGIVTTATVAGSSHVHMNATLQIRNA